MQRQPRRLVLEQIAALAAILGVCVAGWLHLAFNWFSNAWWYFPAIVAGQLLFIVVQIDVWLWSRRNRA